MAHGWEQNVVCHTVADEAFDGHSAETALGLFQQFLRSSAGPCQGREGLCVYYTAGTVGKARVAQP